MKKGNSNNISSLSASCERLGCNKSMGYQDDNQELVYDLEVFVRIQGT